VVWQCQSSELRAQVLLHTGLPTSATVLPSLAVQQGKDGPTWSAGGMSCVVWRGLSDPYVLQPPPALVTAEFAKQANLATHLQYYWWLHNFYKSTDCTLHHQLYQISSDVRFQVLTATSMKMTCLLGSCIMQSHTNWPMSQRCNALMMEVVSTYEMSVSTRLHGATSQKTVIFKFKYTGYVAWLLK
jgi:hypothetical protein